MGKNKVRKGAFHQTQEGQDSYLGDKEATIDIAKALFKSRGRDDSKS